MPFVTPGPAVSSNTTGVQLMKRAGVLADGTSDECAGLAGRLPVFRIDPLT